MTPDTMLDMAARAEAEWERCGQCDRPYTGCTCCPFCLTPDPEHCWWCSDAEHRERMAEWRAEL